ncbi:amidophosphoribosyltransferase [Bordetella genomosp. 5]|uniref:ComF family protein n=1 Tax=Bordetella genomosp. 5 TaxID=1395608 RepID=UPI000B9DFB14|nr:ComF family protein [Bordetella genomosp. 5]OZI46335.1 amidophosphoribosyltransferase [Bordetella genomosp. 5]
MNVTLKEIYGPWESGWALDKHVLSSTYLGDNEWGHPQFDTQRSQVGEASFQLKYRSDWSQVAPLAQALATHLFPKLGNVGFIVPMPASKARPRQPVTEVARVLGELVQRPVFESLVKAPGGPALKDLPTREAKLEALAERISVVDVIADGRWNVLLVDDLYDSGASMEAACNALRGYRKVNKIYAAALTWK